MKKQAKTVKKQEVVEQVVPVVVAPVQTVVPPAPLVVASAPPTVVEKSVSEDVVPMEKRNMRIYWAGIFVAVFTLVTTGVVFWRRLKLPAVEYVDKPIEAVEEKVEVVEVSEPVSINFDREKLTIEVLNGAGETGLAGRVASKFEDLGYKEVLTGNADKQLKTRVVVLSGTGELDEIELDLEKILGLEISIAEDEDLETDIRIVLGQDATTL